MKTQTEFDLDNNRHTIAMMILEGKNPKRISQNLASYWIRCKEEEFSKYIKEKPLDKYEIKQAENLLRLKRCREESPTIPESRWPKA